MNDALQTKPRRSRCSYRAAWGVFAGRVASPEKGGQGWYRCLLGSHAEGSHLLLVAGDAVVRPRVSR